MKKVIIVNFFIIFLLIFILEILIRSLNLVSLQGYDKNIFFSENNITLSKSNKSFKVFGKKSKTDINGFRIPLKDFSYDKSKNFTLILGDSVTYGVGVEEKNSFIGILRKRENKNNLLNSAIMGHNLESYLYLLKKNKIIFDDKIDKSIIFLCLNDIVRFQGVVFNKNLEKKNTGISFFKNIYQNTFLIKLNLFLREKSSLFVFIKSLTTNPVKRHFQYMNALYDNKENLIEFENYLNQIKEFSDSKNINLKFVLLPYAYQVINNCDKNYLKPQNEIAKIFKNLDYKYIDYTEKFCQTANNKDLFLPFDPVHLSKSGHKHVSDLLIQDNIIN